MPGTGPDLGVGRVEGFIQFKDVWDALSTQYNHMSSRMEYSK